MSPLSLLVASLLKSQAHPAHVQVMHVHKDRPRRDSGLHGS